MHYARNVWIDYILGQMPEEKRKACEAHLYDCSECLNTYLECLDELADRLPRLADEWAFKENVMFAVESAWGEENGNLPAKKNRKRTAKEEQGRPVWNSSFFHYAVASVITLVLTLSGTFHSFSAEIHHVTQKTLLEQSTPYSQQIIDKTARWLDQIRIKGGIDNE